MRYLFTFLLLISFFPLLGQNSVSLSYSTEEEHAQEWVKATTNWTGLPVGSPFPSKTFTTLDGKEFSIPGAGKKLYVVHFWFVGCGSFLAEEENLKKLREEFKDKEDIAFISFSSSPKEDLQKYFKEKGNFGYEVISMGSKKDTEDIFKVAASTTHMLVNDKGEIIENFTTSINFDEIYDVYKTKIQENM